MVKLSFSLQCMEFIILAYSYSQKYGLSELNEAVLFIMLCKYKNSKVITDMIFEDDLEKEATIEKIKNDVIFNNEIEKTNDKKYYINGLDKDGKMIKIYVSKEVLMVLKFASDYFDRLGPLYNQILMILYGLIILPKTNIFEYVVRESLKKDPALIREKIRLDENPFRIILKAERPDE